MSEFLYQDPFPLSKDTTEYRLLSKDYVTTDSLDGRQIIKITPEGLTLLAEAAFRDVSHLLRRSHLKQLSSILDDPESDFLLARLPGFFWPSS